ncbi:MAG: hypothetical protein AABX71_00850 [Nanoarchaeota archaeon]
MNGIMESQIDLKVLGIKFQSENYCFRDDGFVEDIHAHARKVNQEFGDDPASYDLEVSLNEKLPLVGGLTRVRNASQPIPVIICYYHQDSPLKEIFVRGHEETHALQEMGRLHLLQERLVALRLKIDIGAYSDNELIADIGGLYAVIKHGFPSLLIMPFLDKEGKDKILEFYLEFLGSKNPV